MGWGSGTTEFPYLVDPLSAISSYAAADGTTVKTSISDSDLVAAAAAAAGVEVAFVFVNADSGEGFITGTPIFSLTINIDLSTIIVEGNAGDRNDLYLWHGGDALIQAVAAVNSNTVVVVHAVGPVDMETWVENPNSQYTTNSTEVCLPLFLVSAIIWAGLPGQESGQNFFQKAWALALTDIYRQLFDRCPLRPL